MKKIISFSASVLFVIMSVCSFVFAAQTIPSQRLLPRLNDEAGIIPDEFESTILNSLDKKSEQYSMDIVIATVSATTGDSIQSCADDYFDYNGFGYGENADGIILFISMNPREVHIGTCGSAIELFYTDYIIEDIYDELKSGDYKNACYEFIDEVEDEIQDFTEEMGDFDGSVEEYIENYYNNDNDYNSKRNTVVTLGKVGIAALIIGVILGCVKVSSMEKKMKSVQFKREAADYLISGSMKLTDCQDNFLYNDVKRTPIPQNNSSSGGSHSSGSHSSSSHSSHTSSSGRSHGGSSRGF